MSGYVVQRSAGGYQEEERSCGSFHWKEEARVGPWKMDRIWLGGGKEDILGSLSTEAIIMVFEKTEETSLYRVISKYDLS